MTRTPGLRGLLPARPFDLPFLHTLTTSVRSTLVPESDDTSHGFDQWLSLGNAPSTGLPGDTLTINDGKEVGDCFFAAVAHGLVNKALILVDGQWVINPELVAEIQLTADRWVGLYLGYQNQLPPGQTATSGPDNGTEPVSGFQWLTAAGIITRWGPVDPSKLNAGAYDHDGVLTAWALDEDTDEEFAEHKPWLNLPQSIDPIEGGHATYRVGWTPRYGTEITWGADQLASLAWEKAHLQGAFWFQAPWEPDAAGYDFGPLDEALSGL